MNLGAQVLRVLVDECGSQTKFSQQTDVDQGYLSKLLSGGKVPGGKVGRRLRDEGIPLDWWLQAPVSDAELLRIVDSIRARRGGLPAEAS